MRRVLPGGRENAVVLAGAIAVDAGDASRAAYATEIGALRALALECLPGASSDTMFVYLQQAVLGLDGDDIWGKELDRINDGEYDVQCPECEEEILGGPAVQRHPRSSQGSPQNCPAACTRRPCRPAGSK